MDYLEQKYHNRIPVAEEFIWLMISSLIEAKRPIYMH